VRGRLINPFGIELRRLDVTATASSPGYDPIFREPSLISSSDGLGSIGRREMSPIIVPGQFTTDNDFMLLQMLANGNAAKIDFRIVFHFADLEYAGLIEASTGLATIRVRDRLSAIYDVRTLELVQAIPNPPGVFVTEANPRFGLGASRNLLVVSFSSRDQGQTASAAG
jgi:hypothetical protein